MISEGLRVICVPLLSEWWSVSVRVCVGVCFLHCLSFCLGQNWKQHTHTHTHTHANTGAKWTMFYQKRKTSPMEVVLLTSTGLIAFLLKCVFVFVYLHTHIGVSVCVCVCVCVWLYGSYSWKHWHSLISTVILKLIFFSFQTSFLIWFDFYMGKTVL